MENYIVILDDTRFKYVSSFDFITKDGQF